MVFPLYLKPPKYTTFHEHPSVVKNHTSWFFFLNRINNLQHNNEIPKTYFNIFQNSTLKGGEKGKIFFFTKLKNDSFIGFGDLRREGW